MLETNNANSAGTILFVNSIMPTGALAPGYDRLIYSNTNYNLEHRGMSPRSLPGRANGVVLPGVTETGEENKVLVTAAQVNNRDIIVRRRDALDDFLYNASFIKLRYVSLIYNLPCALYEKIGFAILRTSRC